MDAGKWLSRERGALNIEEAQEFEAVPPVSFPMAERIKASELVDLFRLRETLPIFAPGGGKKGGGKRTGDRANGSILPANPPAVKPKSHGFGLLGTNQTERPTKSEIRTILNIRSPKSLRWRLVSMRWNAVFEAQISRWKAASSDFFRH